jgi:hypothetical protein
MLGDGDKSIHSADGGLVVVNLIPVTILLLNGSFID